MKVNFLPVSLLVLSLNFSVAAFGQVADVLLSSGDGRNGPDLSGVANPKGADIFLDRQKVMDNFCTCTQRVVSSMYRQLFGKDIQLDDKSCSIDESNHPEISDGDTLVDGKKEYRVIRTTYMNTSAGSYVWNFEVDPTSIDQFVRLNVNNPQVPTGGMDFTIALPLLQYKTRIDKFILSDLGEIEEQSVVVSEIKPYHSNAVGKINELNGKVYRYYSDESLLETKARIDLKAYEQCITEVN